MTRATGLRSTPVDRRIAAGLTIATGLLGVTRVDDHAFWVDEAFTATVTGHGFGDLVHTLGHEAGMVPYYVALWCWQLLGHSEGWLRMLSVSGGACAVGALFLLAAHVAGRRTAVVAVAMLLANPAFLFQLTELRTYSWVMFLAVASTLQFIRLRDAPPERLVRTTAAYGALVGLLVSSLVFALAVPLAHACFAWPLARRREARRALWIGGAVALVVLSPALPALLTSDQLDWIRPLDAHRTRVQYQLSLGSTRWAVVILCGVMLLALDLLAAMRRRTALAESSSTVDVRWLFVTSTIAGPALLVAISLRHGVFISRYLAGTLPLAVLAAALGYVVTADRLFDRLFDRLAVTRIARVARASSVVPLCAVVACAVGFDGNPFDDLPRPEDLRSPSVAIVTGTSPDSDAHTAIVFDKKLEATAFEYYLPDRGWTQFRPGFATPPAPLSSFCHVWWISRIPVAELAGDTGHTLDELTLTQFHGVALVEFDNCATLD